MVPRAALLCLLLAPLAYADDEAPDPPEPVFSDHTLTLNGQELRYQAAAGSLTLSDYEGKPKAEVFFVAYTKLGVDDPRTRPLTFSFNGGPGSSSVWLHLGALGPKRVEMGDDEGRVPAPPYRAVPNQSSWLDLTDLVFVDPVSTGYSRARKGEDPKQFHGLREDLRSVGEFIRRYVTRYQRWGSPKFLVGESYGTTRAAGLAQLLQRDHGMDLNGIVLVSPVLNFQTLRPHVGNDLPYWLFLPTFTATAHYHQRLAPELQADFAKTLQEVEAWAASDYVLALAQGDALPAEQRTRVAQRLARYTGLSQDYVEACRLRIPPRGFFKQLLRDQSRTVGRLDSRYLGIDRHDAGYSPEFDPSYAAIQGPYTAVFQDYVRRELRYEDERPYEILTGRVRPWSYREAENRYVNVSEDLRRAMSANRHLHVLFCSGYYDLATPHFASDYTVRHLGLDPSLRGNLSQAYYHAGHMMYLRLADLRKLKADVQAFYARALAR